MEEEEEGKKRGGRQFKGARKRKGGKPVKLSKTKRNRKSGNAVELAATTATGMPGLLAVKSEAKSDVDEEAPEGSSPGPSCRPTRNRPRRNYSEDGDWSEPELKRELDEEEEEEEDEDDDEMGDSVDGDDDKEWGDASAARGAAEKVDDSETLKRGKKKRGETSTGGEGFTCDLCSKAFKNRESFRRHVRRHEDPDALLACPHCAFKTLQKSTWVQHLAVIHKEDPHGNRLAEDMKCTHCSFSCVTKYQLKAHVVRKHGDKPFKCTECAYSSSSKSDIEKHVSIRHREFRAHMCHLCGFRSQTKGGYNRHLRSHEKVKPFHCTICNKRYADSPKLKSHLLRHMGDEKRFVCQFCGHSCRRLDNLQMHMKRIHKTTITAENAKTYFQVDKDIDKNATAQEPQEQGPGTTADETLQQSAGCEEQYVVLPAECAMTESMAIALSQAFIQTAHV